MKNKKIAMKLLRKAALALAQVEGNVLFPGWDWENPPVGQIARYAKIVQASRGITADNVDLDNGTHIPTLSLSYLVQYIGDMLEE